MSISIHSVVQPVLHENMSYKKKAATVDANIHRLRGLSLGRVTSHSAPLITGGTVMSVSF